MIGNVFEGARPAVHLNVVARLHNIKTKWLFNAAKLAGPWQGMLKNAAQPSNWMCLIGCITSDKKVLQHRERNWSVFGGAWPSHKFECFWRASYDPDEIVLQHREMIGNVFGGARPSVHLNVVECLHNIKTKWIINTAKRAGPWQGMLGSAAQPSTWMCLIGCITSRQKVLQHRERNWSVCGGARPSHKFEFFWKTSYHPEKTSFQQREMPWIVFGGARTSVQLKVVESLHNIKTKWFLNAAKWAGPWQGMLGSAVQPSTWMCLIGCITSDEKVLQHRERNWAVYGGARPSHEFQCLWIASYHPEEKSFQHRKMSRIVFGGARPSVHLNVVECLHNNKTKWFFNAAKWAGPWQGMLGSAAQPSTWMCLIGCITSRRKVSSTPWKKLGRVWGSTAQP